MIKKIKSFIHAIMAIMLVTSIVAWPIYLGIALFLLTNIIVAMIITIPLQVYYIWIIYND